MGDSNLERYHRFYQNWMRENGPCAYCGSWERLEMDHIDPSTKHPRLKGPGKLSLWCLPAGERETELAKCQALCFTCHREKSNRELLNAVCVNNHPQTPENTRPQSDRRRRCILCMRIYRKRRNARISEERKLARHARQLIKQAKTSPCISFS